MSTNECGMSAQPTEAHEQRTILPTSAKWSPEQSRLWIHMSQTHNMNLTSTEEMDIRHAANAGAAERIRTLERELTAAKAECERLKRRAQWHENNNEACSSDADHARLRADLERFTAHGLLDCHAICDQRDEAVAERDRLRAEVERLTKAILASDVTETCKALESRAEKAEAQLHALRLVCGTSDADRFTTWLDLEIAKREKAEAEHDALAKDRDRLNNALGFICKHGGMTVETECGEIQCTGVWCAEQARAAMKGTP